MDFQRNRRANCHHRKEYRNSTEKQEKDGLENEH